MIPADGFVCCLRKDESSGAFSFVGPVEMRIPEGQRVVVKAPGELGRQVGAGLAFSGILLNRTAEAERVDDRLQAVLCAAGGKRKGVLVAFHKRARQDRKSVV